MERYMNKMEEDKLLKDLYEVITLEHMKQREVIILYIK
jgi:hypothetical protein